jgi:hypothetical protein
MSDMRIIATTSCDVTRALTMPNCARKFGVREAMENAKPVLTGVLVNIESRLQQQEHVLFNVIRHSLTPRDN